MTLIQIFLLFFAAFALVRVGMQFHKKILTRSDVIVWASIWTGVAFVALLPSVATRFANFVGVGRGSDLVLYLAAAVLFYAVFRIFARIHALEKILTNLVRKQALKNPRTPEDHTKTRDA